MRLTPENRFLAMVVLALGVVIGLVLWRGERKAMPSGPQPQGDEPGDVVPWCADGLAPIAGGGCFAAPTTARRPLPLVIYLHGRHGPGTVDEELRRQARVAKRATARGVAVLALRGKQGECTDPSYADNWCWPSNERTALDAPAFVDTWTHALAAAEKRAGKGPRMVLGFSNGGYFTALLATRALFPADAFAIAGAGPVGATAARGPTPPVLLVTADDDPANDEMLRLDAELAQIAWPHHIVAREGGHDLVEADVEMALTFFLRTRSERLPLSPPLSTRAPRRRPPDAGSPDGDAAASPDAETPERRPVVPDVPDVPHDPHVPDEDPSSAP